MTTPVAASPYNATVVGREPLNSQLLILRVRPDAGEFNFPPGQFAVLGLALIHI